MRGHFFGAVNFIPGQPYEKCRFVVDNVSFLRSEQKKLNQIDRKMLAEIINTSLPVDDNDNFPNRSSRNERRKKNIYRFNVLTPTLSRVSIFRLPLWTASGADKRASEFSPSLPEVRIYLRKIHSETKFRVDFEHML
jgi:hypothetical protein